MLTAYRNPDADQVSQFYMWSCRKLGMLVKPAMTFTEQLHKLLERGLAVDNHEFALSVLQRVNYYRFTGYLLQYKQADDTYAPGTTFEGVYRIYEFDAELRNLLVRVLEHIEISIRTKISYYLGHVASPLAYRYHSNFRDKRKYLRFRKDLKKELRSRNKKDAVVTHHFRKYKGRFPIWVAVEFMSFGQLSTFFSNLTDEHQRQLANGMGVTAKQLRSWLHCMVYIRNVCAHYSRVYGKNVTIKPDLPSDVRLQYGNDKLFAVLYVCARLCKSNYQWDRLISDLLALLEQYDEDVNIDNLGLFENWNGYLTDVQRTYSVYS